MVAPKDRSCFPYQRTEAGLPPPKDRGQSPEVPRSVPQSTKVGTPKDQIRYPEVPKSVPRCTKVFYPQVPKLAPRSTKVGSPKHQSRYPHLPKSVPGSTKVSRATGSPKGHHLGFSRAPFGIPRGPFWVPRSTSKGASRHL